MRKVKAILRRIGPGFIVASVVLGPGSIIAASRAGAEAGYRLLWVLGCSGLMMAVYTSMAARLGCALDTTPLDYISRRVGRWLAFLAGLSGFLVVTGFQFGNNLGVAFAMSGMIGGVMWIWPLVFTGLSLIFLAFARELYQVLERMMLVLVAVMMISFVANLFWSGVSVGPLFAGLVPRGLNGNEFIIASAMLATTFSVVGAFYQAYLVRAKGWKREDLRTVVGDAWAGIATLGVMSAVILIGCAEACSEPARPFKTSGNWPSNSRGFSGGPRMGYSAADWPPLRFRRSS
jgi:NRAMP (natural resistance-associated macrophage protein)-like metal ion transporter